MQEYAFKAQKALVCESVLTYLFGRFHGPDLLWTLGIKWGTK